MMHVNFQNAVTNSIRKNYNYHKTILFAKIKLLGRTSKISSSIDTSRYPEVLHAEFHDATISKWLGIRGNKQTNKLTNKQTN